MHAAGALLAIVFSWPLDYELLRVENARLDPAPLVAALDRSEPEIVRQAIRALGRFERPGLAGDVLPFLSSPDPDLRIEAANALAQMKAEVGLAPHLDRERDARVRAALYEAMGRLEGANEPVLLAALGENDAARLGAVKGLETFYRTTDTKPGSEAIDALRRTVRQSRTSAVRKLALLALLRAGDVDPPTLDAALADADAGVRRLAVSASRTWRDDPSYIVRYEALRVAGDCARAEASLADPSEHVVLLAIDKLGEGCSPRPLERVLEESEGWRRPARALVSLARVDPEQAKRHLARFVSHSVWQARVYAARAAKILDATTELERLRKDSHPNVVAAALVRPEDALEALRSDDYGLLMAALALLENWDRVETAVPVLLDTLARVSSHQSHTSRDPRMLLLDLLKKPGEVGGPAPASQPSYLLSDFDPAVAARAAEVIEEKTGRKTEPVTTHFVPDPMPSRDFLQGLSGARASLRMKEVGAFVIELFPEVAPITVARFVALAERGYYDGLTFHRIVPNFVIQGGSPGANEYVGTASYLRDEVSLLSHERGTLGISTRGRDTGDCQIFVNLADNHRLDHNYTVFARVVAGMEAVDAILEGDVIESIEIDRAEDRD